MPQLIRNSGCSVGKRCESDFKTELPQASCHSYCELVFVALMEVIGTPSCAKTRIFRNRP